MSALHVAVTSAIAGQDRLAPTDREVHEEMARVALSVVLADVQRTIEALPVGARESVCSSAIHNDRRRVLAAIAALGGGVAPTPGIQMIDYAAESERTHEHLRQRLRGHKAEQRGAQAPPTSEGHEA